MTSVKNVFDIGTIKIMGLLAALASLTAFASATNLCSFWFNQPVMPESVRMMNK